MKEIRPKEDKAVSPIIATILLIAITVVLAATLVTILGGFTHDVSNTVEIAGATVFEGADNESATTGLSHPATATLYLNISSSSSTIPNSQVQLLATMTNGYTLSLPISGSSTYSNVTITASSSNFAAGSTYIIQVHTEKTTITFKSIELEYKGNSIYTSGTISIA